MKHFFLKTFLALTLIFSGNSYAQEVSGGTKTDTLFYDDFSAGSLDREKWNVIGPDFWVNNEQQIYVDSMMTIFTVKGAEAKGADNALVLKAHYAPDF